MIFMSARWHLLHQFFKANIKRLNPWPHALCDGSQVLANPQFTCSSPAIQPPTNPSSSSAPVQPLVTMVVCRRIKHPPQKNQMSNWAFPKGADSSCFPLGGGGSLLKLIGLYHSQTTKPQGSSGHWKRLQRLALISSGEIWPSPFLGQIDSTHLTPRSKPQGRKANRPSSRRLPSNGCHKIGGVSGSGGSGLRGDLSNKA